MSPSPSSDSEIDSISSVERNINQYNKALTKSCKRTGNDEADGYEGGIQNPESDRNKYICNYESCGKTFGRADQYDRHEFVHTGVKKYICFLNDCDKSYITTSHLKRHVRTFHEKILVEKTIKCRVEHCNSMFDSLHNMEKHMLIHEKTRIFKCTECDKQFRRKQHLRLHEIKHKGDFPFNCEKCQKGFVQGIHLKRHKCKNYTCEECSKFFLKWSQLVEHKQSEHKKSYSCVKCSKIFTKKSLLKAHEEYHKQNLDREVIQCPIEGCPRYYFHQKNLNHHIKVKHEGKKFKCPVENCKIELVTKQKLDSHIKKIHKNMKSNVNVKKESKNKQRKRRKDFGQSKKSLALKLAGISTNSEIEKQILNNAIDMQIVESIENAENNELENENKQTTFQLTEIS